MRRGGRETASLVIYHLGHESGMALSGRRRKLTPAGSMCMYVSRKGEAEGERPSALLWYHQALKHGTCCVEPAEEAAEAAANFMCIMWPRNDLWRAPLMAGGARARHSQHMALSACM